MWSSVVRRESWSTGESTRTSWPVASSSSASASMCRVTPPGYVHEYGETRATRTAATIFAEVPTRHFVKYPFLKVDPAWRRLDADVRAADKREFAAACADFAEGGHLLRAF